MYILEQYNQNIHVQEKLKKKYSTRIYKNNIRRSRRPDKNNKNLK